MLEERWRGRGKKRKRGLGKGRMETRMSNHDLFSRKEISAYAPKIGNRQQPAKEG